MAGFQKFDFLISLLLIERHDLFFNNGTSHILNIGSALKVFSCHREDPLCPSPSVSLVYFSVLHDFPAGSYPIPSTTSATWSVPQCFSLRVTTASLTTYRSGRGSPIPHTTRLAQFVFPHLFLQLTTISLLYPQPSPSVPTSYPETAWFLPLVINNNRDLR